MGESVADRAGAAVGHRDQDAAGCDIVRFERMRFVRCLVPFRCSHAFAVPRLRPGPIGVVDAREIHEARARPISVHVKRVRGQSDGVIFSDGINPVGPKAGAETGIAGGTRGDSEFFIKHDSVRQTVGDVGESGAFIAEHLPIGGEPG